MRSIRREHLIDLVAIGSPHASFEEVKKIKNYFSERKCHPDTKMIITVGRQTLNLLKKKEFMNNFLNSKVQIISDNLLVFYYRTNLSIETKNIITNSGKYAHYAHGLSGRHARLSNLQDCVEAAIAGFTTRTSPGWL